MDSQRSYISSISHLFYAFFSYASPCEVISVDDGDSIKVTEGNHCGGKATHAP